MTEYFTTSELGYAAFAESQGFEDVTTIYWNEVKQREERFDGVGVGIDVMRYDCHKTPHNVALMEKQEDDICIIQQPTGTLLGIAKRQYGGKLYIKSSGFEYSVLQDWTIIHRNGIPMPQWDKEGV
jgi:hypothetical protein